MALPLQIGRFLAIFLCGNRVTLKPRAMKPEVQKHVEYASGYLDLKMYDDAVREADIALALSPNAPQAIAIKSAALWQANRLSEAEPCVAKLAELNPRDADVWINL